MSEEVKDIVRTADLAMTKGLQAMQDDFQHIRTGRASPTLVEKVPVEYYGSHVPLQQLASISVSEGTALLIKPFDATTIKSIERAIQMSDLKLTPSNDGKIIRLAIPPMTQERRREVVKMVHKRVEEAKVSFRNARHEGIDLLREYENEDMINEDDHKQGKQLLDELIQKKNAEADDLGARKEKEVMDI